MKKNHQTKHGRKGKYDSLVTVTTNSKGPAVHLSSQMHIPGALRDTFQYDAGGSHLDRARNWANKELAAAGVPPDWNGDLSIFTPGTYAHFAAVCCVMVNTCESAIVANHDARLAAHAAAEAMVQYYTALFSEMTEKVTRGANEIQSGINAAANGAPTQKREQGIDTMNALKAELKKRKWTPDRRGIAQQLAGVNGIPENVVHVRRLLASLKTK